MAVRKRETIGGRGVRDVLMRKCERSLTRFGDSIDFWDDFGTRIVLSNPAARRLRLLRSGATVSVSWWEVARFLTAQQRSEGGRWIVQEDGSLLKDL